jgi:hypothetical protein
MTYWSIQPVQGCSNLLWESMFIESYLISKQEIMEDQQGAMYDLGVFEYGLPSGKLT